MKNASRYQLRYAAGKYWLIDMEQKGLNYRKPAVLNECGAFIWKMYDQGATGEQIAEELQRVYGISHKEAEEDTRQFIQCLKEQRMA